ncbi:hypothetical protein MED01_002319 [Micromonospora sp. MED01]|uniref:hypothetical protein n=1 Tax=Micromonospora alfalfae TaxID=2911212 RepID=UPI001EE87199|nr:hypothetical protein [Micromonospora alfalfae]MCG5464154.1 hypothetical protein [Micromonospora alfalfae]
MTRLTGKLHNAIREALTPAPLPANVLPMAAGRATVRVPRVREIDGPTIRLPRAGEPGVNEGRRYTPRDGRHRAPDTNVVPARFTRQRVA